jgi:hypothetical protein
VALRVEPASVAADPAWLTVSAWQGGGLHLDRLRRTGPNTFVTTKPVPLRGEWKAMVRIQDGRRLMSAPIRLPADPAIPVGAVPARADMTRPLQPDAEVLQRERKLGVPMWLWTMAGGVVLALALGFLAALAWGVGRLARATAHGEPPRGSRTGRFDRAGTRRGAATPA